MKRRKNAWIVLIAGAGGLVAVALFVVWFLWQMIYWQIIVGMPLENQLGFSHSSPYLKFGDRTVEVFTFGNVSPTGIVGRAGITNGCIPITLGGQTDLSFTKFYRILHGARGQSIELRVVPGGDGLTIEERPIQSVTFEVPEE